MSRSWQPVLLLIPGFIGGCGPLPGPVSAAPGGGGGALGVPPGDTGLSEYSWTGFDSARVTESGVVVCDRVWETVGVPSDVDCDQCEIVVDLTASLREQSGQGDACPAAQYGITYAYRATSVSEALPAGLLARQPGGWVWIGDAQWDGERLVGEGWFTDDERETHFAVVGKVDWR